MNATAAPPPAEKQARAFLYDAEGHDREVKVDEALLDQLHERALVWIDLEGRSDNEIRLIANALRLDRVSLGDLLKPRPTPRLDNFGKYLQFSLFVSPEALRSRSDADAPPDEAAHVEAGASRLDFVVGHNWVLTVHDDDLQFLRGFRGQDKGETEIGRLSAPELTASLLDWHLESFFAEAARIALLVDRLDEHVLAEPSSERLLARILAIRRRVSRLRRLLLAQRPVFYGLNRPDLTSGSIGDGAGRFELLATRFERAVDEAEHTRDLVVGSFELFTSRSAQQTNDLVRALTFFTIIVGCASAIAGLFGMNFDPPFFKSGSTGFFAVILGLVVLAGAAWMVGRRRRWI